MSRHGAVELDFGDGTFTFRLGLEEIEELEEKRDASLFALARRLDPAMRDARLADIKEVIRLGLVGGGTAPTAALRLIRRYIDERPIDESRDVAFGVVLAGLARVHSAELERPPLGEAPAPEPNGSTSASSEAKPS
jgi:hypothetical protein